MDRCIPRIRAAAAAFFVVLKVLMITNGVGFMTSVYLMSQMSWNNTEIFTKKWIFVRIGICVPGEGAFIRRPLPS